MLCVRWYLRFKLLVTWTWPSWPGSLASAWPRAQSCAGSYATSQSSRNVGYIARHRYGPYGADGVRSWCLPRKEINLNNFSKSTYRIEVRQEFDSATLGRLAASLLPSSPARRLGGRRISRSRSASLCGMRWTERCIGTTTWGSITY